MYEETPNKEEIDWLAERVREIYDYERLKDCDIDYLYNQEYGMQADAKIFEMLFPDDESALQGPMRAFIMDEENADREALTQAERVRLQMLKKEAEIEIHRAFGHRKELHRKHRSKLSNAVSDALSALESIFSWG
ncbi:hypothetical protein HWV23_07215 [Natronomonas halophila]|uniref:hypothetical protein n=1 Tax=Natronomonas halophila TaxID=2747817 RepID=UPI0015B6DCEA|nr:hypothetical protein [Natronomonas halophila]QLD85522.1 hypothetical protein HWV23_07215 [Natronomonas halophila]